MVPRPLRYAAILTLVCGCLNAQNDRDITAGLNPYIRVIRASSHLVDVGACYPTINLIDGTELSWAAARNDPKPTIDLLLHGCRAEPISIENIYIKNGFGLPAFFKKNNRVKDLKIEAYYDEDLIKEFMIPNGPDGPDGTRPGSVLKSSKEPLLSITVRAVDSPDIQEIHLPCKIAPNLIRLTVLSVYPGNTYNDTCISEISLDPIARTIPGTSPC